MSGAGVKFLDPNYYEPLENLKGAYKAAPARFQDALFLREFSLLIGMEAFKIKDWALVQGAKAAALESRRDKEKYWGEHSNYTGIRRHVLAGILKDLGFDWENKLPKPIHKVDIFEKIISLATARFGEEAILDGLAGATHVKLV